MAGNPRHYQLLSEEEIHEQIRSCRRANRDASRMHETAFRNGDDDGIAAAKRLTAQNDRDMAELRRELRLRR